MLARCLLPPLRGLKALGVIHVGVIEQHLALREAASVPPPRSVRGGPPPDHPERLCQDVPLSGQERLLAHDLWPAYYPQAVPGPRSWLLRILRWNVEGS